MLTLNLQPIFTARGIESPLQFLIKNGIPRDAAFYLINAHRPYIKISYIERLCELLLCEPNDLFRWQPGNNVKVKEEHPLFPLYKQIETTTNFMKLLEDVPYKKLSALSELLSKEIEGKDQGRSDIKKLP